MLKYYEALILLFEFPTMPKITRNIGVTIQVGQWQNSCIERLCTDKESYNGGCLLCCFEL